MKLIIEATRESREDYEALLELELTAQGITQEKNIIVYDENGTDAEAVCDYLQTQGITNLFYHDLNCWEGDLFKYPNYRLMAPMSLVKNLIDGKAGASLSGSEYKIFEISWKEPSPEYLKAHIPGAVHIDSNEFELGPKWTMVDDEALTVFAARNGITPDSTVVTYASKPQDFSAAAKLAVVLRYMGLKNVMCLNGTLENWIHAGYPTEEGLVEKQPCGRMEYDFRRNHALHMKEVKELLAHPEKGTVIDVRPWEQYIGEDSGYDYLDKAGRIPGTKWCTYPRHYRTPVGQIGNLEVMLQVWEAAGIDVKKTMAFFCGSASWGASILKTFANVAGLDHATIYEGGWCEWCADPENDYETGIPDAYKEYDPEQHPNIRLSDGGACHVM